MMTMPIVDDPILAESLRCLSVHLHPEWGDRHLFDVFGRLIAKNLRRDGWASNTHLDVEINQIASRQEQWTTEALGKLTRGHSLSAGQDFDCPIIIAEYAGAQRVLDGNHRINRWVKAGDTRLHPVNIHTVTAEEKYVELPANAPPA